MNNPLVLLLIGVVLVVASVVFRSQSGGGNMWQIVLGIGILLEIAGAAGMYIEAKKRRDGNGPRL